MSSAQFLMPLREYLINHVSVIVDVAEGQRFVSPVSNDVV